MKKIKLSNIITDAGTQMRETLDEATVANYREAMESGAEFPPVVVYSDGVSCWLADGFHRVAAAKAADLKDIQADERRGDLRAAILHAVSANATHGKPRSPADKRRAVLSLMEDSEWSKWSDHEIARRCGVSQSFTSGIRKSLNAEISDTPKTYTTKHGTVATMNTANIGRTKTVEVISEDTGEVLEDAIVQTTTVKREKSESGISDKALMPIRGHSNPEPLVAMNVPRNAKKAADALLAVMGREFLFDLKEEITALL